jgi:hypothetical protein
MEAGWYQDGMNAGRLRYWDGEAWTYKTRAKTPFDVVPPASIFPLLDGVNEKVKKLSDLPPPMGRSNESLKQEKLKNSAFRSERLPTDDDSRETKDTRESAMEIQKRKNVKYLSVMLSMALVVAIFTVVPREIEERSNKKPERDWSHVPSASLVGEELKESGLAITYSITDTTGTKGVIPSKAETRAATATEFADIFIDVYESPEIRAEEVGREKSSYSGDDVFYVRYAECGPISFSIPGSYTAPSEEKELIEQTIFQAQFFLEKLYGPCE